MPTKYLLWISGLFLATVWYQASFSSKTLDESDRALDVLFDGNVYENRLAENRTPPLYDEFWLTESDMAILPFDVDFEGLDDSYGTIQPAAYCNEHNDGAEGGSPTKIIFSHVVRTEASWVQEFLSSYASSCHAGFVSTGTFLFYHQRLHESYSYDALRWDSILRVPKHIAQLKIQSPTKINPSSFLIDSHLLWSFVGIHDEGPLGEQKGKS